MVSLEDDWANRDRPHPSVRLVAVQASAERILITSARLGYPRPPIGFVPPDVLACNTIPR